MRIAFKEQFYLPLYARLVLNTARFFTIGGTRAIGLFTHTALS